MDCKIGKTQNNRFDFVKLLFLSDQLLMNMKRYPCDICDKSYTHRLNLYRHKTSTHEGNKYNCDKCDKQFFDKSGLSRHEISSYEGKKYFCTLCEKTYADMNGLIRHNKVTETVIEPIIC